MTALGPFLGSFRGQENADGQPKAPGIRWFPRNPPRGEGINSLSTRSGCPVVGVIVIVPAAAVQLFVSSLSATTPVSRAQPSSR